MQNRLSDEDIDRIADRVVEKLALKINGDMPSIKREAEGSKSSAKMRKNAIGLILIFIALFGVIVFLSRKNSEKIRLDNSLSAIQQEIMRHEEFQEDCKESEKAALSQLSSVISKLTKDSLKTEKLLLTARAEKKSDKIDEYTQQIKHISEYKEGTVEEKKHLHLEFQKKSKELEERSSELKDEEMKIKEEREKLFWGLI